MSNQNNIIVSTNREDIIEYFDEKSYTMKKYLEEHSKSSFVMIRKKIAYADVLAKAKRTKKEQSFSHDLLTYLTTQEMEEICPDLGVAKQSNINMPSIFYTSLGIEQLKRRSGHQETQHKHLLINDYANVYLVNESYEYFKKEYTFEVLNKLIKEYAWDKLDLDVELSDGDFTEIELRHAIHGIGTKDDTDFYKIRHNLFRNDILVCVIEDNHVSKKLYLYLQKNPKFYSILNLTNDRWQKYLEAKEKDKSRTLKTNQNISTDLDEKSRLRQSKWRNMLAEEAMNYTIHDDEVFCPFTMIRTNYSDVGTLFRASHIKRFEKCELDEAYDINNGLLLSANADALFDKFLITVDENKNIIFSFLLENDQMLKQQLLLNQELFKPIFNEKRMEYMKWHREEFNRREEERKK